MDTSPDIGGRVIGKEGEDFSGFSIEFVNTKTLWKSGRIALRADGVFLATLHVEKGDRNSFKISLFDRTGATFRVTPDSLNYTIGAVVDEQPLTNSIGVALADNVYLRFFEKGGGLPLKATKDLRVAQLIRKGNAGDLFRVPIVEGEHYRADRNRLINTLAVDSGELLRDLPAGSEVEVTLRIDESRQLTVSVYVPLLDKEIVRKVSLLHRSPNPDALREDFERK